MRFLVDAQLPPALANLLRDNKFDVVHTSELPNGSETTDAEINALSIAENRIVISKDGDFYDSFAARRQPYKLLHVKTGNISNAELLELVAKNLSGIVAELAQSDVVTIDQRYLIALT